MLQCAPYPTGSCLPLRCPKFFCPCVPRVHQLLTLDQNHVMNMSSRAFMTRVERRRATATHRLVPPHPMTEFTKAAPIRASSGEDFPYTFLVQVVGAH